MKNTLKYILMTGIVCFSQACTDDFEKINTPPTSVTTIDPGLILSKVQKDAAFSEGYEYPNNQYGSWIQHWAGGVLISSSRYIEQSDNSAWESHYTLIRNISQIRTEILKGQESDPAGRTKLAIARIVEISVWQRLTDLFGDVPYSQTALGSADVNTKPVFDTQESVYKSLITDLDAATAQLTAGDVSYGNADFYYKGDVAKWKKYANSLKLRLGMRIRYADPALAQKTVTEAMGQPLLAANSDDATVPTYNNATNANVHPVLNHFLAGSPDLKYLADAFVTKLVGSADPRLPRIAQPSVNSVKAGAPAYKGIGVALTDEILKTIIKDDYSTASTLTFFNRDYSPAIPCIAMSFADVSFYKAEAALEGWGATEADAEKFYQDGVKAALAQAPYNITVIPAGFEKELSFTGLTKAQKLEKIGTQKWIQLFGRSYEAFIEWRRMGYPVLKAGPFAGSTNGTIPRRTIYSSREALLNEDNYREAVGRLSNGDSYISKVWWDKK
ncbi:SusD/RagB family nutrient-binding outer membrane lipoprotein [Dyadobacter bucti]|uniref:SusD/RagB family nutrient-binding outer membrane lipoprotein n=1 Tax=Dyadobacter bucti TaxID=2572203 RepID=UPI00110981A6|nr:SusD/RagB family nutrient-binding outer membrane lipoprotein [Dyadobacter bucti]